MGKESRLGRVKSWTIMHIPGGLNQPNVELWTEYCPSGPSCTGLKQLGLYPHLAQSLDQGCPRKGGLGGGGSLQVKVWVCWPHRLQHGTQPSLGRTSVAMSHTAQGTGKNGTWLSILVNPHIWNTFNFTNGSPFLMFILLINNKLSSAIKIHFWHSLC